MNKVLDIESLPEYWDKIAAQRDADAVQAKRDADTARANAFRLRAEQDEPPRMDRRHTVSRKVAAHQRLLGLDPYGRDVKEIETGARKAFADARNAPHSDA